MKVETTAAATDEARNERRIERNMTDRILFPAEDVPSTGSRRPITAAYHATTAMI